MKKLLFVILLSCAFGFVSETRSAEFPKRPVTIVVPWEAGGGSDLVVRALAKPLEKELGKPVIISNKPGGSGTVGTSRVAHAKPDGYTIGLINDTGLIHQHYYGVLDYKRDDLDPLALILRAPVFLVVNSHSPIKNLADFVNAAKEKEGMLTLGTAAMGGGTHMAIAPFFEKAGIRVRPVAFNGGGSVVKAVAGNHIDSAVVHPSEVSGHVRAGNVRILGVLEDKRLKGYEDVPTFREQGYDVTGDVWRAFLAPRSTPAHVRQVLVNSLAAATRDQGYLNAVTRLGDTPVWMGPEEFAKFMAEENERVLESLKAQNLYNRKAREE